MRERSIVLEFVDRRMGCSCWWGLRGVDQDWLFDSDISGFCMVDTFQDACGKGGCTGESYATSQVVARGGDV